MATPCSRIPAAVTAQPVCICSDDDSEATFSFQFCISSLEMLCRKEEVDISESTEIAFQLSNFCPLRVAPRLFQRDASSHSKYIVRGGKICQFKSSMAEIQKLKVASSLKVMLYLSRGTSLAAGKTNLNSFLTAFLTNGIFVKKKFTITVFDNTKCPFARLHLKLSLEVVGCHASERDNTEQVDVVHPRGIGVPTVCNPPVTVVVQAQNQKESTASSTSEKLPVPTVPSPGVNHDQKATSTSVVWPNGYIEDAGPYLQHTTGDAESPYVLPSTGITDNVAGYDSEHYPLLEALCDEISSIRKSRKDHIAELTCKDAKIAHDKCLQTDSLGSEMLMSKEASRKENKSVTRSFTRPCCVSSQERVSKLLPNVKPKAHQNIQDHSATGAGKPTSQSASHTGKQVHPIPKSQVKLSKPIHRRQCNVSLVHHNQSPLKVASKLGAKPSPVELEVINTSCSAFVQPSEQERVSGLRSSRSSCETEISELQREEGPNSYPPSDGGRTELANQQSICDTPKTVESVSEVQSRVSGTTILNFPPVSEIVNSSQQQCLATQASESRKSDQTSCDTVQHSLSDKQLEMTREGMKQKQPVLVQSFDSLEPPELEDEHNDGDVHTDAYGSDFEDFNDVEDDDDDDDDDNSPVTSSST